MGRDRRGLVLPSFNLETIISFIAFFLACFSWLYALWCHRAFIQLKRDHSDKTETLTKALSVYSSGMVGIGDRIVGLEQRLRSINESQTENRQQELDFSYMQAQKLIEQGLDASTVAANSGLTPSEVNLMQLLHRQSKQI